MKSKKNFLHKQFLKERKKIFPKGKNKEALEAFKDVDIFFTYQGPSQLGYFPDEIIKVCSLLYHHDKDDPAWKKWCAYSAFINWEFNHHGDALGLAIIADEWDFIKSKNWKNAKLNFIDYRTLAKLTSYPKLDLKFASDSEIHEYWELFLVGVLEKEEEYIIDALHDLRKLEEEESFQYEKFWPAFNVELCTAAAIAKKNGIAFNTLDQDLREYLFAGLNDLATPSVYEDFLKGA